MYLCYNYLPHLPASIFGAGNVVWECHFCFRGKWDWTSSGLLIIWAGQRQQLGLTSTTLPLGGREEETEDYRNQLHWGAGLQGCGKGSDHPDPEDQKVEEIHMPLCCIWKGFVFSSYRETIAQMIEENLNCLGHLSTIIHEANEEQGNSMMVSFIWIWVF